MSTSRLIFSICVTACVVGCAPGIPSASRVRITGNLSSNDVNQIQGVVNQELIKLHQSVNGLPIKSISVTTNNHHEFLQRVIASMMILGETNAMARDHLPQVEQQMHATPSRPAVAVWYANGDARWGEAGFLVENETNHWMVTLRLFH